VKIHSHYDNLKVSRDAPQEVIRAAYKTLSQKYHPDRRLNDPDAERVMKIINASYAVLSDPAQRKEHDEWLARKERDAAAAAASAPPPRSAASHQAAWQASGAQAGSHSKPQSTTRPAKSATPRGGSGSQARPQPRSAQPKARGASGFSLRKISLRSWSVIAVLAFFGYVALTESMTPWPFTHESGTGYGSRHVLSDSSAADGNQSESGLGSLQTVQAATPSWPRDVSVVSSAAAGQMRFVRPSVAPNRLPWPSGSGYLDGVSVAATGGHSSVMVDNTINRFDVYGKLVLESAGTDRPVREFFIRAGQRFTLTGVAPGHYDVRYQNLDEGGLYKSPAFGLAEQSVNSGFDATHISVTLYPVQGSMQAMSIEPSEF
jgi:hypothetical protein